MVLEVAGAGNQGGRVAAREEESALGRGEQGDDGVGKRARSQQPVGVEVARVEGKQAICEIGVVVEGAQMARAAVCVKYREVPCACACVLTCVLKCISNHEPFHF